MNEKCQDYGSLMDDPTIGLHELDGQVLFVAAQKRVRQFEAIMQYRVSCDNPRNHYRHVRRARKAKDALVYWLADRLNQETKNTVDWKVYGF